MLPPFLKHKKFPRVNPKPLETKTYAGGKQVKSKEAEESESTPEKEIKNDAARTE